MMAIKMRWTMSTMTWAAGGPMGEGEKLCMRSDRNPVVAGGHGWKSKAAYRHFGRQRGRTVPRTVLRWRKSKECKASCSLVCYTVLYVYLKMFAYRCGEDNGRDGTERAVRAPFGST